MVIDQIKLDKGIAQVTVDSPKSEKEIEEDKNLSRQLENYKKYKELYGEFDKQYEDAEIKQKEHVHPTLKYHDFINKMI